MATSLAAMTARRAATLARISPSSSSATRAASLIPRRGLASSADHHGPPRVNIWEDPMSPSNWKDEHFVIASLTGWFTLFYGSYKFFTGGKSTDLTSFLPEATRTENSYQRYRAKEMLKQMLTCCKVYISESRNKAALEAIEMAAKLIPEAPIVNKFEDAAYNRVGYTLVSEIGPGPDSSPLRNAVFEMVKAAFEAIDLGLHCGSHPRLGVVDHICFHPLNGSSLDCIAGIAKSLAADVGAGLQVATFLYGAAQSEGRSLDMIRRELGYFKPNADGNQWVGSLQSEALQLKPNEGPPRAVPRKGVVVIGATQWVDNYNVPIFSTDMAAVRRIAKRISSRGGGLPSVQSMALAHGKGMIEVACNLLDTSKAGGEDVQRAVEQLAQEEGMDVGEGYYTDLSQSKIVESYCKLAKLS